MLRDPRQLVWSCRLDELIQYGTFLRPFPRAGGGGGGTGAEAEA